MRTKTFYQASKNPVDDISEVAYNGQSPDMRMYKSGYERYFEALPKLSKSDWLFGQKLHFSNSVMAQLADELIADPWISSLQPLPFRFNRTILAIEPSYWHGEIKKEGSEIIVARWGDGFTSPIHGHAEGLLYEQVLFGRILVNTYQIIDEEKRIVRPLKSEIFQNKDQIISSFSETKNRSAVIHNFTSIGPSATLHFVPEHTRDGRDNGFSVQYFEDTFNLQVSDFKQLSAMDGIRELGIGDIALVRSKNVSAYGDHYIVITGKPILKDHGLRPQDIAIAAPTINAESILNSCNPIMGLTLLKLNQKAAANFLSFHRMSICNGEVIFNH